MAGSERNLGEMDAQGGLRARANLFRQISPLSGARMAVFLGETLRCRVFWHANAARAGGR